MSERHKHEWEPDGSGLYICAGCSKTKTMFTEDKCFACGRGLKQWGEVNAKTQDGQVVLVGPECHRKIHAAKDGYQPPLGGPRLFDHSSRKSRRARLPITHMNWARLRVAPENEEPQ